MKVIGARCRTARHDDGLKIGRAGGGIGDRPLQEDVAADRCTTAGISSWAVGIERVAVNEPAAACPVACAVPAQAQISPTVLTTD